MTTEYDVMPDRIYAVLTFFHTLVPTSCFMIYSVHRCLCTAKLMQCGSELLGPLLQTLIDCNPNMDM